MACYEHVSRIKQQQQQQQQQPHQSILKKHDCGVIRKHYATSYFLCEQDVIFLTNHLLCTYMLYGASYSFINIMKVA